MYEYVVKVILVMQCCSIMAHSSSLNTKLLDQEAEACISRLWAHNPINEAYIQKSLNFVYREDAAQDRYKQNESFMNLVRHAEQLIENPTFLDFSKACKNVFDQQNDLTKVAVPLNKSVIGWLL